MLNIIKIKKFNNLIKKIAKFVVKVRKSTILASTLAELKKTVQKNNTTHWNSIKNLLHSYNKLNDAEISQLLSLLTDVDRKLLKLTPTQRAMTKELELVFDNFLYASKKFEEQGVTSPLVYPTISYLKNTLLKNLNTYKHTKELRQELVKGLCKRFGAKLNNDVFLFATFLDPHYGPFMFPSDLRQIVIDRLVTNIIKNDLDESDKKNEDALNKTKTCFEDNFLRYDQNTNSVSRREKNRSSY